MYCLLRRLRPLDIFFQFKFVIFMQTSTLSNFAWLTFLSSLRLNSFWLCGALILSVWLFHRATSRRIRWLMRTWSLPWIKRVSYSFSFRSDGCPGGSILYSQWFHIVPIIDATVIHVDDANCWALTPCSIC